MGNVGWTWTGLMNWRQMLIDSHARARAFRRLVMTDKQGHTHAHTHTHVAPGRLPKRDPRARAPIIFTSGSRGQGLVWPKYVWPLG